MKRSNRSVMAAALVGVACVCLPSNPAAAVRPPGITKKGTHALRGNTGSNNTAIGFETMDPDILCSGPGAPNPCCTGLGKGTCGSSGSANTSVGALSLEANTTGTLNTAVGAQALEFNDTGGFNAAVGNEALRFNTSGFDNAALGSGALRSNTTGFNNTGVGAGALNANTSGGPNTAVGAGALYGNSTGAKNTALGFGALGLNTTGGSNTAVGDTALQANTGSFNTAVGVQALLNNTTGTENTALGAVALGGNSTGFENTALGEDALVDNTTGSGNTALGQNAISSNTTGFANTAVGQGALSANFDGNNNTAIGPGAGSSLTTGDHNIYVGSAGFPNESNSIHIGQVGIHTATYIAGISGATTSGGVPVFVDSSGGLGTITSSARYKDDIRDMGNSTSGLMQLRPVRFRYKKDIDPSGLEQYGLVAEEVAKVYPDLVVYGADGKPQTVRYHFINAMLLNEVQKQAHQIEALTARLAQLEAATTNSRTSLAQPISTRRPRSAVLQQP